MTIEQKIAYLAMCDPQERDRLLSKWSQTDTELHFALNANNMSMEKFVNQDKFKRALEDHKTFKGHLADKGWSKDRKTKLIGQIPANIYFSRKEFSPDLPKEEHNKNVRKFLSDFPQFQV